MNRQRAGVATVKALSTASARRRLGLLVLFLGLVGGLLLFDSAVAQDVFIPLVPNYEARATPQPTQITDERVYGLVGRLQEQPEGLHSYRLTTAEGRVFALAGQTPALELDIAALAAGGVARVKVWGEVQPLAPARTGGDAPTSDTQALIVVSGIMASEPASTVGGASAAVAVVDFDLVNLHALPNTTSPKVGEVTHGQGCNVTGRNSLGAWLELTCADGTRGWIDARLVTVQGALEDVPVIDPRADPPEPIEAEQTVSQVTPTPTPREFEHWRTEMYANPRLAGRPVTTADVESINFDWGDGSPDELDVVDNFALRFERTIDVTPGFYHFTAEADDGVRVWLDDQLIIDEWHGATNQTYSVGRVLVGSHDLRVEYYEASGLADLRFTYGPMDQPPAWETEYYRGITPEGTPAIRVSEPRSQHPLDYNWVYSSPNPAILGRDAWSARWTGTFQFEGGNYQFQANADDGVRVYLDGLLVIDQWRDGYKQASNRVIGVGGGEHQVTVEYYERSGQALVDVWWYKDSDYTGPQ